MTDDKKGSAPKPNPRKERLAAQLRSNLLKRKAQARQRKVMETPTDSADKKD